MPKITVELDDSDMAELDAEARAKRVSPEKIITRAIKDQFSPGGRAKRVRATGMTSGAAHEVAEGDRLREKTAEGASDPTAAGSLASRQAARRAALLPAFGMWAEDDSKPKDGVAYQKAVRAEWD